MKYDIMNMSCLCICGVFEHMCVFDNCHGSTPEICSSENYQICTLWRGSQSCLNHIYKLPKFCCAEWCDDVAHTFSRCNMNITACEVICWVSQANCAYNL
jgi:hypothetical protein